MRILALLLLVVPLAASASTLTVNTTADNLTGADGKCTLREAIANVNAAADTTGGDCVPGTGGGDTITFSVPLPASVRLSSTLGELAIAKDVNIVGPASGVLAVDGRNKTRVFHITTGTTSMANLTIERGRASNGAGMYVEGATASLMRCVIKGNNTLRHFNGSGGGIMNAGGTVTLNNSTLTGNTGGGGGAIYTDGTLALTNSSVNRNKAGDGAGAIYNLGTMTLSNSTLNRNLAGVSHSCGNCSGGAISNDGTMTVSNCTLSRNGASGLGGGIENGQAGVATLTNCTISNNAAGITGTAIFNSGGSVSLTNCTLSRNRGVGTIWNLDASGRVHFTDSIIAGSPRGENCVGFVYDGGHNLGNDDTCFSTAAADPRLSPLGNYGGPTETNALCTAVAVPHRSCTGPSPAIDAGDDSVTGPPDNLTTDQRGLARLSGAHVDIGAYEAQ